MSVTWVAIRQRKVNGHCQVDFTTAKNVFEERVLPLDLELLKLEISAFLLTLILVCSILKLSKSERQYVKQLVLATWHRLEEFKFYFALNVVSAEVCRSDLNLIPAVASCLLILDLRLVDWSVLAKRKLSVDDEEAQTRVWKRANRIEDDDLRIGRCLLFNCGYHYLA